MKHIETYDRYNIDSKVYETYTGTIFLLKEEKSYWVMNGQVYKQSYWDNDWTTTWCCDYLNHHRSYVKTFEEMFESLPRELQEIVVWNLDIWKLDTVKDIK